MGDDIKKVADEVAARSGRARLGPIHPLVLARSAGLEIIARPGPLAILDGDTLYVDDARDGWREAVSSLACGRVLRNAGCVDTIDARRALALALGAPEPMPESWGEVSTAYC